ncbi:MAG: hypothetical protein EA399_00490 [Desulfovibrionales bacterium]|nr:MAG: hypothetical protein EA399_00490 [Desulfovibrionales bacterium]
MQWHVDRYRLGQAVALLVRVGKFYELHGLDARKLAPLLGLNINSDLREGAVCAGFPAWMQKRYLEKLLSAGVSVAVLEEQGPGRFVTERRVDTIYHLGGGPYALDDHRVTAGGLLLRRGPCRFGGPW